MGKIEDIENVTSLNHSLNNVLGMIESGINLIKNADTDTLEKRWIAMRDALMETGRDRINREIEFFRGIRKAVERVSTETYTDLLSQLLKADKYYKSMFDILIDSKEYTEDAKNASFAYGNKMVCIHKNIINCLEAIKSGLQKI